MYFCQQDSRYRIARERREDWQSDSRLLYCATQTRAYAPTALVRNLCVVLQKHLLTALSDTFAANAPFAVATIHLKDSIGG